MDRSTIIVCDGVPTAPRPPPAALALVPPLQQEAIVDLRHISDQIRDMERGLEESTRMRQEEATKDSAVLTDLRDQLWTVWRSKSENSVRDGMTTVTGGDFTDTTTNAADAMQHLHALTQRAAKICRRDGGAALITADHDADLAKIIPLNAGAAEGGDTDVHSLYNMLVSLASVHNQQVTAKSKLINRVYTALEKELADANTLSRAVVAYSKDVSSNVAALADDVVKNIQSQYGLRGGEHRGELQKLDDLRFQAVHSSVRNETDFAANKASMARSQQLRIELDRCDTVAQVLINRQLECASEKIRVMRSTHERALTETAAMLQKLTDEYDSLTTQIREQQQKKISLEAQWRSLGGIRAGGGGTEPSTLEMRAERTAKIQQAVAGGEEEAKRSAVRERLQQQLKHEVQRANNTIMMTAQQRLDAHEQAARLRLAAELQLAQEEYEATVQSFNHVRGSVQRQIAIRGGGSLWASRLTSGGKQQCDKYMVERLMKHLQFIDSWLH